MISFNLGLYWIVAELWFITRKHDIQQSYAGISFYYNSKLISDAYTSAINFYDYDHSSRTACLEQGLNLLY